MVAAFEDLDVTICSGCTTLRAELPDQAALHGAINRLMDSGLESLTVKAVEPPAG